MKCHGYVNACACPRCLHRAQSYNVRGVARKEVRQFINAVLTPHGWTRVESDSAGHLRFWHPEQQGRRLLSVPQTPSDHRWRMNTLRDARRIWPGQPSMLRSQQGRASEKPPAEPAPESSVARVSERTRSQRLLEYAASAGIRLTEEQAAAILDRVGTLALGRQLLDRMVAAKRRQDDAA